MLTLMKRNSGLALSTVFGRAIWPDRPRLLSYLGAMPAQLREVDNCLQSHRQGNVRITLQAGRKNLLRLRE
jgi:hypothetical protein